MDEEGNATITGYKLLDNQTFLEPELAETYVLTVEPVIREKDSKAADMVTAYLNHTMDSDKKQVFSVW